MMLAPILPVGHSLRPDPYWGSVVLRMHMEGSDGSTTLVDEKGHTMTALGNAQLDTADSRFGASSLLLDGSGDYVTSPDSEDWNFAGGDFTVALWFKATAATSTVLISHWVFAGDTNRAWALEWNSNGTVRGVCVVGSSAYEVISAALPTGVWHFVSLQRSGGTLILHVNGIVAATAAMSGTVNNSNGNLALGAYSGGQQPFQGGLDEVTAWKGVAVFGPDNYVPPRAPFPNY